MKDLVIFLFILMSSVFCFAQQSEIEISYDYRHFNPTGKMVHSTMSLIADHETSKFYSVLNEKVDSMMTTPEGRMAYGQMVQAAMAKNDVSNLPIKKEPMYVLKSRTDNTLSVYDLVGTDFWTYTEPLETQEWCISDSTKNILGYECIKAECSFRGRKWLVWFTPEIPISEGPWKLNGLPGVILSAEDSTGQYSFFANSLSYSTKTINLIFGKDNYETTERLKYLQAKRAFTNNAISNLQAATGTPIDNLPNIEISQSYDFLEMDYHK